MLETESFRAADPSTPWLFLILLKGPPWVHIPGIAVVLIWDLLTYLSPFPNDGSLDNHQRRGIACQLIPTPMEDFQSLDSLKAPIVTNMESIVSTTQKAETRGLIIRAHELKTTWSAQWNSLINSKAPLFTQTELLKVLRNKDRFLIPTFFHTCQLGSEEELLQDKISHPQLVIYLIRSWLEFGCQTDKMPKHLASSCLECECQKAPSYKWITECLPAFFQFFSSVLLHFLWVIRV